MQATLDTDAQKEDGYEHQHSDYLKHTLQTQLIAPDLPNRVVTITTPNIPTLSDRYTIPELPPWRENR